MVRPPCRHSAIERFPKRGDGMESSEPPLRGGGGRRSPPRGGGGGGGGHRIRAGDPSAPAGSSRTPLPASPALDAGAAAALSEAVADLSHRAAAAGLTLESAFFLRAPAADARPAVAVYVDGRQTDLAGARAAAAAAADAGAPAGASAPTQRALFDFASGGQRAAAVAAPPAATPSRTPVELATPSPLAALAGPPSCGREHRSPPQWTLPPLRAPYSAGGYTAPTPIAWRLEDGGLPEGVGSRRPRPLDVGGGSPPSGLGAPPKRYRPAPGGVEGGVPTTGGEARSVGVGPAGGVAAGPSPRLPMSLPLAHPLGGRGGRSGDGGGAAADGSAHFLYPATLQEAAAGAAAATAAVPRSTREAPTVELTTPSPLVLVRHAGDSPARATAAGVVSPLTSSTAAEAPRGSARLLAGLPRVAARIGAYGTPVTPATAVADGGARLPSPPRSSAAAAAACTSSTPLHATPSVRGPGDAQLLLPPPPPVGRGGGGRGAVAAFPAAVLFPPLPPGGWPASAAAAAAVARGPMSSAASPPPALAAGTPPSAVDGGLSRSPPPRSSSRPSSGGTTSAAAAPTARRFACRLCAATFDRDGHRAVHVLAVHKKERPFACDVCGSAFGHRYVTLQGGSLLGSRVFIGSSSQGRSRVSAPNARLAFAHVRTRGRCYAVRLKRSP